MKRRRGRECKVGRPAAWYAMVANKGKTPNRMFITWCIIHKLV
jgi:hypothetical protein